MSLGGAMALLATIQHGPLLPGDHGHDARSKLFYDASTYALAEEEAREVIGSSDAAFCLYCCTSKVCCWQSPSKSEVLSACDC